MMLMKNKVHLTKEIKRGKYGIIPDRKRNSSKNLGFLFNERENVLNALFFVLSKINH